MIHIKHKFHVNYLWNRKKNRIRNGKRKESVFLDNKNKKQHVLKTNNVHKIQSYKLKMLHNQKHMPKTECCRNLNDLPLTFFLHQNWPPKQTTYGRIQQPVRQFNPGDWIKPWLNWHLLLCIFFYIFNFVLLN